MHLVCARMKLICIKGLEDDDNNIHDVFMLIIPTGSFLYAGIYSQKEMVGDVARWIKNADEVRK